MAHVVVIGAGIGGMPVDRVPMTIVHNMRDVIDGREPTHTAAWNAICLAALWARQGKWAHVAKVAYEKYVLKLLGIVRLKDASAMAGRKP